MKRTLTSAVLLAGVFATAGIAQAQTFDSPTRAGEVSTMTGGAPNALTTNSPYSDGTVIVDTRVLGSGPAVVTTYGTSTYYGPAYYSVPSGVVVYPSVQYDTSNSGLYSTPYSGSYYGN